MGGLGSGYHLYVGLLQGRWYPVDVADSLTYIYIWINLCESVNSFAKIILIWLNYDILLISTKKVQIIYIWLNPI